MKTAAKNTLCLCLLFSISCFAIARENSQDSTAAEKAVPDSLLNIPLYSHGLSDGLVDYSDYDINRRDIQTLDYMTLPEILYEKLPAYPMHTGSFGNMNNISLFGAMPQQTAFGYGGRPIMTPSRGMTNPSAFSPEFLESIEVFSGTGAAILRGRPIAVNIQEVRYNSEKPYTRIWFGEAGFDLLGADGIFSQNFAPDWNFTFGFRSLGTEGRFDNSWLESWNVRALLRWNLSPYTNISLTENFTNQGFGSNGGIDPESSPDVFDDLEAVPIYNDLNERQYRHDVTLNFSSVFDSDTSKRLTAGLFFTNIDQLRKRPRDLVLSESFPYKKYEFNELYTGFSLDFEQKILEILNIKTGGSAYFVNMPGTPYAEAFDGANLSAYILSSVFLSNIARLDYGFRFDEEYGHRLLSYGAAGILNPADSVKIKLDISVSGRPPTAYEGYSLEPENITSAKISTQIRGYESRFSAGLFYKQTENMIATVIMYGENERPINSFSKNNGNLKIAGAYFTAFLNPVGNIFIKAFIQGYYTRMNGKNIKQFPAIYSGLTAYYEFNVGRSMLRLGAEGEFLGSFRGMRYYPVTYSYYLSEYNSNPMINGINVFARARLGNAFVKAEFNNSLSSGYYYMPVYPQPDRNIRLSVAWAFMD